MSNCPFCNINPSRIIASNDSAFAIFDGFPISPNHALIIPKRHIASLFEATNIEREALLELVTEVRVNLRLSPATLHEGVEIFPDGFNIGINDGAAAGQTVMHLHIHLIPRYVGDQPDPRGGVRWIFPEKADYWSNRK
ncbi:putative HIT-like protein [Geobacter sp. OR-1]|uniref:HIT family protein n=1 Tax=Geobacter sp. OR-1 TaxID=1266765 RepID=UPI000541CCEB|nr:HIT family protein [Geobacter sp. OR-1]GAM10439.1 putative HIT-like protein [Geobacter sp. OR-1]